MPEREHVGVIVSYRRGGGGRQYPQHVIVRVLNVTRREIGSLVGAKVIATDKYGNIYKGKVVRPHGRRNSLVIVRFKPNIPGQLLGTQVRILS